MNHTSKRYQPRPSAIVALCIISESEIAKLDPKLAAELNTNETKLKLFLFNHGVDIAKPILKQENIPHRNRFHEVLGVAIS